MSAKQPDFYINHESRITIQEKLSERIEKQLDRLDDRMDSQFKWIVGILITTVLLPIVLHVLKLV